MGEVLGGAARGGRVIGNCPGSERANNRQQSTVGRAPVDAAAATKALLTKRVGWLLPRHLECVPSHLPLAFFTGVGGP